MIQAKCCRDYEQDAVKAIMMVRFTQQLRSKQRNTLSPDPTCMQKPSTTRQKHCSGNKLIQEPFLTRTKCGNLTQFHRLVLPSRQLWLALHASAPCCVHRAAGH
eukprot:5888150-Amphidinium_carterae.1